MRLNIILGSRKLKVERQCWLLSQQLHVLTLMCLNPPRLLFMIRFFCFWFLSRCVVDGLL